MNETELLLNYRPWLLTVARNMLGEAHHRYIEDVAQEGWIAIWRAKPENYDCPDDYILKQAATRRMWEVYKSILAGEQGAKRGLRREKREHIHTELTDFLADPDAWTALSVELPAIELAYHYGEIALALAELTPQERRYVYLRFWQGYDGKALNEHFGTLRSAETYWTRGARPKLAQKLSDLRSTVGASTKS